MVLIFGVVGCPLINLVRKKLRLLRCPRSHAPGLRSTCSFFVHSFLSCVVLTILKTLIV